MTALRLIARRGYVQTSIGDIAEEAGMLKGNLAYYFKTKPILLTSVIGERRRRVFAQLQPEGANRSSAMESIQRLIIMVESSAAEMARSGCPVGSLAAELGKNDSELHEQAAGLLLEIETWLRTQFARELSSQQATESAEYMLSQMQGAAILAHAHRDPAVVARQMKHARSWLVDLLGS